MACWLGWIVAALLAGYLLGMREWRRPGSLRRRCEGVDVYQGRRYVELMALLGGPAQEVDVQPTGRLLRTWRQGDYAITLCFDAQDVCLGVHDEQG